MVQSKAKRKTRLSPLFRKVFKEESEGYNLAQKIDKDDQTVQKKLIPESIIENIDNLRNRTIDGERINVENEKDLELIFNHFVIDILKEDPYFHPEDVSISNLKQALYNFFSEEMNINIGDNFKDVVCVTLSGNLGHFSEVIRKAKESYNTEVQKRGEELNKVSWNVPETVSYNQEYEKQKVKKIYNESFFIC